MNSERPITESASSCLQKLKIAMEVINFLLQQTEQLENILYAQPSITRNGKIGAVAAGISAAAALSTMTILSFSVNVAPPAWMIPLIFEFFGMTAGGIVFLNSHLTVADLHDDHKALYKQYLGALPILIQQLEELNTVFLRNNDAAYQQRLNKIISNLRNTLGHLINTSSPKEEVALLSVKEKINRDSMIHHLGKIKHQLSYTHQLFSKGSRLINQDDSLSVELKKKVRASG